MTAAREFQVAGVAQLKDHFLRMSMRLNGTSRNGTMTTMMMIMIM